MTVMSYCCLFAVSDAPAAAPGMFPYVIYKSLVLMFVLNLVPNLKIGS
jgi:hypothetical protein